MLQVGAVTTKLKHGHIKCLYRSIILTRLELLLADVDREQHAVNLSYIPEFPVAGIHDLCSCIGSVDCDNF